MVERAGVAVAGAAVVALLAGATAGHAGPAPPPRPHPRIWLDDDTHVALRRLRDDPDSGVARAIATCADARADPAEYARAGFMGMQFAATLSSCALAYQVTGDARDAATALRYFRAVLDDYQVVGDGAGGDDVVSHDTGYAMRTYAAYAAVGYDWLYDAPGMTDELRAHARARFRAWTDWYRHAGYLRDTPGTNYHAGYAYAAALIAVAQRGEAGAAGDELWRHVIDRVFGDELRATITHGALAGGDWPEGWQYGPLAVAEYLLASRALRDNGVDLGYFDDWAAAVVVRHVYALLPDGRHTFAGGDTDVAAAHLPVNARTLLAVIASARAAPARAWARAELDRTGSREAEFPLFEALAQVRAEPAVAFPRAAAPTWYLAEGTGTFYARSDWSEEATWMVAQCAPNRAPDHQHPNAGNVVLTRGADHAIVDPTPYGSLSSLTSNAPAIESAALPAEYRPSQGPWGRRTTFRWAGQTATGIAVARCDYADQFRFRDQPGGVGRALRDVVFAPYDGGAALIVLDRASTGDARRPLLLRFRTATSLAIDGDVARGTLGRTAVTIRRVASSGGEPSVRHMPTAGNCWDGDRGACDLARLDGDEYRIAVRDATPAALHVIDAAPAGGAVPGASRLAGDGYLGVALERGGGRLAVVALDSARDSIAYRGPAAAIHVIVDGERGTGALRVNATRTADGCTVTATAEPFADRRGDRPLVLRVSETCTLAELSLSAARAPAPVESLPAPAGRRAGERRGCGGCDAAPNGGNAPTVAFVLLLLALCRRIR